MAGNYRSFPGMDDILPGEVEKWQWLERKARNFFEACGFSEIRTPILEQTELFARSIGETTDIVHKEMYTFQDRGERSMTMRPEMTASVGRAVVEHSLLKMAKSLALYYIGPMFRAERPQAGRKRQFHQIGVELINESAADADFRVIQSLYLFLRDLGFQNIDLRINDLSRINGPESDAIRAKLKDFFSAHKSELDADSLYRLDKNVLRIFDSKNEKTRRVIEKLDWNTIAPPTEGYTALKEKLELRGIPFTENRNLVRGLDYYTGVVFEVALSGLGAQDAVAGGGRYDRLYGELGKNEVPCTGFSLGMERILMALEKNTPIFDEQRASELIYVAPFAPADSVESQAIFTTALQMTSKLLTNGLTALNGGVLNKLGDHLKKANKMNARYVVICGPDEAAAGKVTIKFMDKNEQETRNQSDIVRVFLEELGRI